MKNQPRITGRECKAKHQDETQTQHQKRRLECSPCRTLISEDERNGNSIGRMDLQGEGDGKSKVKLI